MSHKNIKEELQGISPKLASLKDQVSPVKMPIGFTDSLYTQYKSGAPTVKRRSSRIINMAAFIGVAASLILLIIFIGNDTNTQQDLPVELVESYVDMNFDEYEEFINLENESSDDWISQELENIPESQLISYLENNLDQLDLENFIQNK